MTRRDICSVHIGIHCQNATFLHDHWETESGIPPETSQNSCRDPYKNKKGKLISKWRFWSNMVSLGPDMAISHHEAEVTLTHNISYENEMSEWYLSVVLWWWGDLYSILEGPHLAFHHTFLNSIYCWGLQEYTRGSRLIEVGKLCYIFLVINHCWRFLFNDDTV